MDIKDLNKSQLILLAILLSFVTSIATGITTVTLMQQAPENDTPITRIVRETIEKVSPTAPGTTSALSDDEKQLLENLKAIKPLTVTLYKKGATDADDKVLGTGLFLGDNKVVIASLITAPAEGDTYVVKSALGEQTVSKLTQENDFTVVEIADTTPPPADASGSGGSATGTVPAGTPTDPNTAPAVQ